MAPLKGELVRESVVEVGQTSVTVRSELMFEPEPLIMTSVWDAEVLLEKKHVALPGVLARACVDSSASEESAARREAVSTLNTHHLRFLRDLVTHARTPRAEEPIEEGTLGSVTLTESGAVLSQSGEDHVPAGWLQAGYVVCGLAESLGRTLELGQFFEGAIAGDDMRANFVRRDAVTHVVYREQPPQIAKRVLA